MKKFKSLLAVVLTFAMLFALAGCAEKPQAEREDDETETKETSSETSSEINTPETNTPDYDVSDENAENDFEENTEENIDTSGLPEIPGVDLAYEIEYFVESGFNTHTLKVGEGHTPLAAGWTQVGGKCYTTDESVVEVAKNGNVFARGEGTAYVVITGMSGMYDIYKYIVTE